MQNNSPSKRLDTTVITVAVIIGLLLIAHSVLVPGFVRAPEQGKVTACKTNLKHIGTAIEMYATDHGGKYPMFLKNINYFQNYQKILLL